MPISDFNNRVPTQYVQIVTVDTENRSIQGQLKDGGFVMVAVNDTPTFFRWPRVGEIWSANYTMSGWIINEPVEQSDPQYAIEKLMPGEGRIDADRLVVPGNLDALGYLKVKGDSVVTTATFDEVAQDILESIADLDADLAAHAADTTAVHGIADTSRLITIDNIGTYAPAPNFNPYALLAPTTSTRNVFQPTVGSVIPVTVKGAASQSTDLTQWQDSTGAVLLRIQSDGRLSSGGSSQPLSTFGIAANGDYWSNLGGGQISNTILAVTAPFTGRVPIVSRGASGQTGNLQEWQSNTAALAIVDAAGRIKTSSSVVAGSNALTINPAGTALFVTPATTGNVGTIIKALASQTGDLMQFQDSAGAVQGGVASNGRVYGTFGAATSGKSFISGGAASNSISVTTNAAGNLGLLVKGVGSQTANLQEWQNSSATVLAKVTPAGAFDATALSIAGTALASTHLSDAASLVYTSDSRLTDARTPTAHTHPISDVISLQTTLDGKAALVHTHAIADVTNLQTTLDGKAALSHLHAIADVTGLQTALDGKAALSHSHIIADTTGLQTALDGKAALSHSHIISDTTGLQAALDGKAALSHTHAQSDVTGLVTALAGKAASVHTHIIGDVTGLQTALDGKAALSHTHIIGDTTGLQAALDAKAPLASPTLTGTATTSGLTINGTLTIPTGAAAGKILGSNASGVATWIVAPTPYDTAPIGGIIPYTGKTIPWEYVLANGQTLTQAAYPQGYDYAVAEVAAGNTLWTVNTTALTFTVPNLSDKFIYGQGTKAFAATGGETDTALTSVNQLPSHTHSTPAHNHRPMVDSIGLNFGTNFTANLFVEGGANNITRSAFTDTSGGGTSGAAGASATHNNMPPYLVLSFLVKVRGVTSTPTTIQGPPGPSASTGSVSFAPLTILGDGSDQTTNLQNWISSLPDGCWAFLPKGDIGITAPITITQESLTLVGHGLGDATGQTGGQAGTRIKVLSGFVGAQAILVQRTANDRPSIGVSLRNFMVDGNNKIGTNIHGIVMRSARHHMERVHVRRMSGSGFVFQGYIVNLGQIATSDWNLYDSTVLACTAGDNGGFGCWMRPGATDMHFSSCIFYGSTSDNFTMLAETNTAVTDVEGCSSVQVTACHFYDAGRHNINLNNAGSRSKFVNCKIEGAQQHGLVIDSTPITGAGTGASDVQFSNCNFHNSSKATAGTYNHVMIQNGVGNARTSRLSLTGCHFARKGSGDNQTKYAIEMEANVHDGLLVEACSFGSAGTSAFSLGKINVATGNTYKIGAGNWNLNNEGQGQYNATPGAVGSITIAHGLFTTPQVANIGAANAAAASAPAWRVTKDATNITLTFAANLTAATVYQWDWYARAGI